MNQRLLDRMIEEKYISVQKHPDLDLYIYNYTPKAQYDRVWNEATLQCRGLIMDGRGNVIARPFPKFFNLQEIIDQGGQIPAEDFVVTEKMDGSLGILYWKDEWTPAIATRGSFTSEQAVWASRWLKQHIRKIGTLHRFIPGITYLFEIIYPQNRIVVDYGDREELVLLTALETHNGIEFPYEYLKGFAEAVELTIVEKYDAIRDFNQIEQRPNAEGYVVAFPSTGQRFKIKFDEYVRLHRLVTGINAKNIWEYLRMGEDFQRLLDRVPDEFYDWVTRTKNALQSAYDAVEKQCRLDYKEFDTRKEAELYFQTCTFPQIMFLMLDKRDYSDAIWKLCKP